MFSCAVLSFVFSSCTRIKGRASCVHQQLSGDGRARLWVSPEPWSSRSPATHWHQRRRRDFLRRVFPPRSAVPVRVGVGALAVPSFWLGLLSASPYERSRRPCNVLRS